MSDLVQVRYTHWFVEELERLPPDQQARVVAQVALVERKGWGAAMRDRDVVHLEDGIHEIRVVGKGPAYRALCFVVPGQPGRIVVVTSCAPKGLLKKRKVMDGEITRAKNRRAEWLARREKEEKEHG